MYQYSPCNKRGIHCTHNQPSGGNKRCFCIESNTSIGVIDAELIPAAEYLADMLSSATGYDLKVKEGEGTITLALGDVQGKEGAYTLTAESDKVNITGNSYGGVIAGIESLRQLFPPQIESKEIVKGTDWAIPAVNIQDAPALNGEASCWTYPAISTQ